MAENVAATATAAEAAVLSEKYLTFYIGDVVYGVSIDNVIEILNDPDPPTVVPGIPKYIKGIMNLRGGIVAVIDARLKLGVEEIEYDERSCIIVINWRDTKIGLFVDRVAEVDDFSSDQLAPLPDFSTVNSNQYLSSICKVGERIVLILDCEKFLADDMEPAAATVI